MSKTPSNKTPKSKLGRTYTSVDELVYSLCDQEFIALYEEHKAIDMMVNFLQQYTDGEFDTRTTSDAKTAARLALECWKTLVR